MTDRPHPRHGLRCLTGGLPSGLIGGLALGGLLGLAACTPPPAPSGEARADKARQVACRQHADQIYAEQNRSSIYLDEGAGQSYSPFSGSYVEGNTANGLPGAFQRQEMVSDCVRNSDAAAPASPASAGAGPASSGSGAALRPDH